jgi:hypothetical protein
MPYAKPAHKSDSIAAERRRNLAQGERSGTLGHELNGRQPWRGEGTWLEFAAPRKVVPAPFQRLSLLDADPGFRLSALPWAEFLRRSAALNSCVPDHRVLRYIRPPPTKANFDKPAARGAPTDESPRQSTGAGLSLYDSEYLLKMSAPLVPPKPNEFESA